MNKIVSTFVMLAMFMAACGQAAPVPPTQLPPSATDEPTGTPIPTETAPVPPKPTALRSPTPRPTTTATPTITPVPQDVMEKLHYIYQIMFAVMFHIELAAEAAYRINAGDATAEEAFTRVRAKGLTTENLASSLEFLKVKGIAIPPEMSDAWDQVLQAHIDISMVISRWMDGDVEGSEGLNDVATVHSNAESMLLEAEIELAKLIGGEQKIITGQRQRLIKQQVTSVFPKAELKACLGEASKGGGASRRGKVAFVSDRDGNAEIYVMNADGSGLKRLTKEPAGDYNPTWSPDGKKIAFYSERDGNAEIYVMDADGSNLTRITKHPKNDYDPAWSPDGKRIAFHSHRLGENPQVFIMNADGTGVGNIDALRVGGWSPEWSPDGTRIVFNSSFGTSRDIWIMKPNGTDQVNISHHPSDDWWPAWSPDGMRIAFHSDRKGSSDIYLMSPEGRDIVQLTDDTSLEYGPSWSGDGNWVSYTSDRNGNREVCVKNVDGSEVYNLTNNLANDWAAVWKPVN